MQTHTYKIKLKYYETTKHLLNSHIKLATKYNSSPLSQLTEIQTGQKFVAQTAGASNLMSNNSKKRHGVCACINGYSWARIYYERQI